MQIKLYLSISKFTITDKKVIVQIILSPVEFEEKMLQRETVA